MDGVSFSLDSKAFFFALAVAALCVWLLKHRAHATPFLYYSRVTDLLGVHPTWKTSLAPLPRYLLYLALGFLLAAIANPTLQYPEKPLKVEPVSQKSPSEGIAIYLVVDHSGSMGQKIAYVNGQKGRENKLALTKELTRQFIKSRPNDLIGLVEFARTANILSPLTLDHKSAIDSLDKISVVQKEEDNGTGIGYAIFKTTSTIVSAKHFAQQLVGNNKSSYNIKNTILILITDGFQSPNPLDTDRWLRSLSMEEAAQFAKDNSIKLYIINIEPLLASEQFTPHRHLLERVTGMTGGKLFLAKGPGDLDAIYREINQLEKTEIPSVEKSIESQKTISFPLAPGLILGAIFCLVISQTLAATWLRRIP